jgi:MarR family transcriptional regulator for hemolysin
MRRDSDGLAEPLGRSLVFAAKAIREAFEATLSGAGGSLGTWVVLSALSDVGIVSQTALALHVHLEGATITHHIDRLEAQGLVRRQSDPGDRRVRRLELTHSGTELHHRLLVAAMELERALTAGVAKSDRAVFRTVLAQISANAEAWHVLSAEGLPQDAPAGHEERP